MTIIEYLHSQAKKNIRTIVLPEGEDPRILAAAETIEKEKLAKILLLKRDGISRDKRFNQLVELYCQLRGSNAPDLAAAKKEVLNPLLFGTLLLAAGEADGMVAGASTTTAKTIEPALRIRKMKPGLGPVVSSFIMDIPERGPMIFADCALNPTPSPAMLAQIAIAAAKVAQEICQLEPKIAFLSFSSHGSANHPQVEHVQNALNELKKRAPNLIADGELQVDAAIVEAVALKKVPNSSLKGQANILIFPNLESGNIAYKLVERLAKARAIGPIFSGLNWPINDLSRGCSIDDIVDVVALTAVQSSA